ncbi:RBR-type E3 ubiquitin transferase [Pleurostoma richardsiae]|uniref:RBR-type E3 ubiquitin transferase n=1 Tax=Pleurostoma richardsiae TaxID=41990 RepID=A0AA38S903_9PEZI|nr:RBR-type E3 ubiquitin transferase [Pleurostoma richardsiae]
MQAPAAAAATAAAGPSPVQIPELSDANYAAEVLRLTAKQSEADIDSELAAEAAGLGISSSEVSAAAEEGDEAKLSTAEPDISAGLNHHVRNASNASDGSAATAITTHSSTTGATSEDYKGVNGANITKTRSKSLSFSQYDKFLALVDSNLSQPTLVNQPIHGRERTTSILSTGRRMSYAGFRNGIKARIHPRRKSTHSLGATRACICCREEFSKAHELQQLPCGHTYCTECLRTMINHAIKDESHMPPRCCAQPIPATLVKAVLSREEQHAFLKAVLQFSTPWKARIFCPNAACAEFIPPRTKINLKHPFVVVCRNCRTRVCVMCKRNAHPVGQECPEDLDLDAVLKMGEKSGWRRCYKCRALVELTLGCTHMTCRCKAEFCYICGAVWSPIVGCPNFCNGEEELERRRMEEEARRAELEAEKKAREEAAAAAEAERLEAMKRSQGSEEFKRLHAEQEEELERFRTFERKTRSDMWARHTEDKIAMVDKYSDQIEKMMERHAKTAQHLEDRQVADEMDLRAALEQSERNVLVRLRHMEAYCEGEGKSPDSSLPPRVVTERDRRELGQQYSLRDDMERLHQARVNVMRDRQAKRMEELLERQAGELERLVARREEDLEGLVVRFAAEEDAALRVFGERRERLRGRWRLAGDVLRARMEREHGVTYGEMQLPEWPADTPVTVEGPGLAAAGER